MRLKNAFAAVLLVIPSLVIGCAGPASIGERPDYNRAIHDTSKDQVFYNLIRGKLNEMPFFMDVTEVDASLSWSASLTANPTNLGCVCHQTPKWQSVIGEVASMRKNGCYVTP